MTKFRPSRLHLSGDRSVYAVDPTYLRRSYYNVLAYCLMMAAFPYVSVKTFSLFERLPYWSDRVSPTCFYPLQLERKRVAKMSFDWMIKSLAEKERDIIEEFSDY